MADESRGIADFSMDRFSLDRFSLEGKTALVTGGGRGLGKAFSLALARAGADIFVAGLDNEPGLQGQMEAEGPRCAVMKGDLTAPGMAREAVQRCGETLGPVDILVNNAGINLTAPTGEFSREQWDAMVRVNLTLPFEMIHEAARVMIPRKRGKIINICSLFSWLGGQGSPAYTATKHGMAGLTRTFCDELAPSNIQVNGIAPGYYKTAVTEDIRSRAEEERRIRSHIPAGRWGEPSDLMGAAVFLASPAADYINGAVLPVDGGYLVR